MKKVSLLAAIAISCTCVLACNNAANETTDDTTAMPAPAVVEDTTPIEQPAVDSSTIAAPAKATPAKSTKTKTATKPSTKATTTTDNTKKDVKPATTTINTKDNGAVAPGKITKTQKVTKVNGNL